MASQAIELGPWGGTGGQPWDDGFYTGVRAIYLSHKEGRAIGSFSVVYDLNGKPFEGPKHHTDSPTPFKDEKIELQFPDEYIVNVSGYVSKVPEYRTDMVRSLTIKSNRRTFGPYGPQVGTAFSIPIHNGKIVGFKGSNQELLDSLSIRVAL